MIENWRISLDEGDAFGAVLTGLSKAFTFLLYELLIAKLYVYGEEMQPLRLLYSYLTK